jgi:heavy metal translocating P-type ATPase
MQTIDAQTACRHCGSDIPSGAQFCCAGCESIYKLLESKGFQGLYSMRPAMPVAVTDSELPTEKRASFYLEGVHCLGCLWILEKLPELENGIIRSELQLSSQILTVEINDSTSWKRVTSLLAQLGYVPKLLERDPAEESRADDRRQLTRIGIAAFSAGNIMMLSASLYAGADGTFAWLFPWLSLLLFLPVGTYCALPLYRSALGPLLARRISIDLPIAMAVWAGAALSVGSLLFGDGSGTYFDSLAMLIFLLLASRFLLQRFRRSLEMEPVFLSIFSKNRFRRFSPDPGQVEAGEIRAGDRILLRDGEIVPADGRVLDPESHFDLSLLTGESLPVKLLRGETVESGARAQGSCRIEAVRPASGSRLASILSQLKSYQLSRIESVGFADRVGRAFVLAVTLLSAVLVLWFAFSDPTEGVKRALALLIVTCPCVLAFAIPLAFTRSLQQAARKGILFRKPEKVEALAKAKHLFLDKTGTLSSGRFQVLSWTHLTKPKQKNYQAALALERSSEHPVGKAVARYALAQGGTEPTQAEGVVRFSDGIKGFIEGELWSIQRMPEEPEPGQNLLGLYRRGTLTARISLGDALRSDAGPAVQELQSMGLDPCILSGDTEATVARTAATTGIASWRSRLSPEEKAELVRSAPNSVMVGDGANDALAFQAASVGIAVQGSMELSLKNSDIAFNQPGLNSLLDAVRLARKTMRIVRTNFAFSLVYNLIAGGLAISGMMSPLLAAVIMPSSALTVFLHTQWRTRETK